MTDLTPRLPAAATCGCCLDRRQLLAGGAAFAASAVGAGQLARAQTPTVPFRIDVHHHLAPPDYIAAIGSKAHLASVAANWSLAKSLDDMEAAGVQTAVLSISTPGLWFGDAAAAAKLARICNDYMARLIADNPGRFGAFAALPLPNADAALGEIAYALDTLKADGVSVFTSYEGKWLGDALFVPVFDELNRRKAVVSVHPATAACCGNLIPYIPDNVVEFGADTTRTIASLIFSGAADRWPDIKFIFSHAGGAMPFLVERFEVLARMPQAAKMLPGGVHAPLQRFFYDTAQAANPAAMGALRQLVEPTQILFGTDFPYRTSLEQVTGLAGCKVLAPDLRRIERDNALALLPRLRG
ncbi:MAG: amidohydrolase family protein [Pseudomonadota bacterium]|jgi:predicted TIM-barrel fold metal-dependent hydrolase